MGFQIFQKYHQSEIFKTIVRGMILQVQNNRAYRGNRPIKRWGQSVGDWNGSPRERIVGWNMEFSRGVKARKGGEKQSS